MSKNLSQEIVERSPFRNKFLNAKNTTYIKQRNHVDNLLRNEKISFYSNLGTVITVEPFMSEKVTKHYKVKLTESEKIISCNDQIKKTVIEYFINI